MGRQPLLTPDARSPRDNRIPNTARGLGIPRTVARGLLAIPFETRLALLTELGRVDPHAALRWLKLRPDVERH